MDIVTHAMSGLVLASPFWQSAPLTAAGVVLGSVLPDVDALARVFGKRAFLRWHQTYTHSIPVILAAAVLTWWLSPDWVRAEPWAVPAAAAAALLHVGMDVSNTLGTAVLAPASGRRFCAEWVFFVDAAALTASASATAAVAYRLYRDEPVDGWVSAAYAGFLVAYWAAKAVLRWRAGRVCPPGTVSLVPSTLAPWTFFGCRRAGDRATTYRLNVATKAVTDERTWAVLDERFAPALAALPEFRLMRGLSPAYHVTEAEPSAGRGGNSGDDIGSGGGSMTVVCRDLRIRNFGGRFGQLEAVVAADGTARTVAFHV